MRSRWMVLAAALAAGSLSAHAQGVKPKPALLVIQAPGGGGSVSITFVQIGAAISQVGANQASLDLGPLSYFGGSARPGVTSRALAGVLQVSTDFGIRVDRQGQALKTANVSAFLLGSSPATVTIDAIPLLPSTQVLTPDATFGVVVPHTLAIGIPTSAPAGPLLINVGIMAVTN